MSNRDIVPAAASFLLPGLGQLYLKHYARALLFFVCFTALNAFSSTRVFVLLPVVVASWDAFRLADRVKETFSGHEKWRRFLFLWAGGIAFLGWMSLAFTSFAPPFRNQTAMNALAERAARSVKQCARRLGRLPDRIDQCPFWERDPWGRPLSLRGNERGFEVLSVGRDGVLGTSDDFIYRFRW